MDIRHKNRIIIIQELFAHSFFPGEKIDKYTEKTRKIILSSQKINEKIKKYAPKFPLEKIAKIDMAILQLAIYEMITEKKEPPKVIIDEAVELAKEFGSEKSYAFVNAVLGKIYNEYYPKDESEK